MFESGDLVRILPKDRIGIVVGRPPLKHYKYGYYVYYDHDISIEFYLNLQLMYKLPD